MEKIEQTVNTRRMVGSVLPAELATIGVGRQIASIVEHDKNVDGKGAIDAETIKAEVAVAIATQRNLRGTDTGNMLKMIDIKDKSGKVIAILSVGAGQDGGFNIHEILK